MIPRGGKDTGRHRLFPAFTAESLSKTLPNIQKDYLNRDINEEVMFIVQFIL
jgi:hypothetical protein